MEGNAASGDRDGVKSGRGGGFSFQMHPARTFLPHAMADPVAVFNPPPHSPVDPFHVPAASTEASGSLFGGYVMTSVDVDYLQQGRKLEITPERQEAPKKEENAGAPSIHRRAHVFPPDSYGARGICNGLLVWGLDLETTGLNIYHDYPTQISVFHPSRSYTSLCRIPQTKRIDPKVERMTKVTTAECWAAPEFRAVLEAVYAMVGRDAFVVAHNGNAFDRPMLEYHAAKVGRPVPTGWRWIDSMNVARMYCPAIRCLRLGSLCKIFNVALENAHTADCDAKACWEVARNILHEKHRSWTAAYIAQTEHCNANPLPPATDADTMDTNTEE